MQTKMERQEAWQTGDSLPTLKRSLSPEKIRRYAEVSGDRNPLHLDAEFALSTPYKGIVAHGMLLLGYMEEMLTMAFGNSWLTQGSLWAQFKRPAYAFDSVTVSGNVEQVARSDGGYHIECQVYCRNQHQDILVSGRAGVNLLRGGEIA